jgi:hypothetical protein
MKMKMKNVFISFIFGGWVKRDENVVVCVTHDMVYGPLG